MDENRKHILSESNKILSKLQLLSAFFAEDVIYKVYLRSQVIHQLFESNEDLDINKLELFHLQFTATIVELLKKIKKSNEKNILILAEEIRLNEDLIEKLDHEGLSEKDYQNDLQRQALKIKMSLERIYTSLSNDTGEYPFSQNIHSFSARYASKFYYDIPLALLETIIGYKTDEVYSNAHAIIQRKLMGLLCKYSFKISFYAGLVSGNTVVEVYRIVEQDKLFIYYPLRNIFLLCDEEETKQIHEAITTAKPDTIVQELRNRNDQLETNMAVTKSYLPAQVKQVIGEHYKKISDINFLQTISNFDAQANILRTMLNTDII